MQKTIHLERDKNGANRWSQTLNEWVSTYPILEKFYSEDSVDTLRSLGVTIERITTTNVLGWSLEHPFPFPGTKHHYQFYCGESDIAFLGISEEQTQSDHPRYQTYVATIQSLLSRMASEVAFSRGFGDYIILVKKNDKTPLVELLVY